jgi:[ribosomal protein S18]-alanine N-acetyltransferase
MAALHAAAFVTPRPWTVAELRDLLSSPLVFGLTEGEAGFLLGRVVADEAELLTIAVAPDARRQGLGRKLVAGFLAEARLRGATQAFLEVAAPNTAARQLYLSQGFVASGLRKGYYHGPEGRLDALVMTCDLVRPPDL